MVSFYKKNYVLKILRGKQNSIASTSFTGAAGGDARGAQNSSGKKQRFGRK
jgi:hypothetical protein